MTTEETVEQTAAALAEAEQTLTQAREATAAAEQRITDTQAELEAVAEEIRNHSGEDDAQLEGLAASRSKHEARLIALKARLEDRKVEQSQAFEVYRAARDAHADACFECDRAPAAAESLALAQLAARVGRHLGARAELLSAHRQRLSQQRRLQDTDGVHAWTLEEIVEALRAGWAFGQRHAGEDVEAAWLAKLEAEEAQRARERRERQERDAWLNTAEGRAEAEAQFKAECAARRAQDEAERERARHGNAMYPNSTPGNTW